MTLTEYIADLNAKSEGFKLTEDLNHWAEYGIHTAEELGDYLDMECAINVYKDRVGVRPRHWTSVQDARDYLDSLDG